MYSMSSKGKLSIPLVSAYTATAGFGLGVYHFVANGEFSAILTLSALAQCSGMVFLCMQALLKGSAEGISARAVQLDICAVCFRLSSTLWLPGYLPVDASGDFIYQAFDVCSLAMMIWLLYTVQVTHRNTYQVLEDNVNTVPMVLGSLVLAALFHCDMDDRPIFDTLWMAGLFTSVVAVIPQLWLIMKTGDKAEALVGHYIAALAVSRILSGLFMWEAAPDITCDEWIWTGFSHGIVAILVAHLMHLLLVADFGYYYVKSLVHHGPALPVQMKQQTSWV